MCQLLALKLYQRTNYSCFVEKASDSKKRIAFVGNHWGPRRSCGRILSLGIVVGMPTEHGITWKTHWEAKISASKDAGRDGFRGSQLEKSFQSLEIIYRAGRTCNSTSEFSRQWVTWWELWLWSRGCFRNMSGIMTIVLACVCFQLKDVEWHEYVRSRDQPVYLYIFLVCKLTCFCPDMIHTLQLMSFWQFGDFNANTCLAYVASLNVRPPSGHFCW